MNPWPKPHIAPLSGLSFPNLKLMNSKKVMTTIEPLRQPRLLKSMFAASLPTMQLI